MAPDSVRFAMRRWFQLRLRTLLAAILLVSLPLAWFANARMATRADEAIVARIGDDLTKWYRPTPRWAFRGKKQYIPWFV